jgi:hypothetical protein
VFRVCRASFATTTEVTHQTGGRTDGRVPAPAVVRATNGPHTTDKGRTDDYLGTEQVEAFPHGQRTPTASAPDETRVLTAVRVALAVAVASVGMSTTGSPGNAAVSQPPPLTDPDDQVGWMLREDLSDEFDGTAVDTTKWYNGWNTWTTDWRWNGDANRVNNGTLKLTTSYDPSDEVDPSPNAWSHGPRGFLGQAGYVTTNQHRSGQSALVHWHRYPYSVATKTDVRNLQNGRYTLRAWVWSSGGTTSPR